MQEADFVNIISRYVPVDSIGSLWHFFKNNAVNLRISKDRTTKYGDFKHSLRKNDIPIISINGGLNQYSFLITLLHEIAHYKAYKQFRRLSQPHGIEWKRAFQQSIAPYINSGIFPQPLEGVLRQHMQNPRASTHGDQNLLRVLNIYDTPQLETIINLEELRFGDKFALNGKLFSKGEKRRTRYMCTEINTDKKYTINALAKVEQI